MKKIITLLICILSVFILVGCSDPKFTEGDYVKLNINEISNNGRMDKDTIDNLKESENKVFLVKNVYNSQGTTYYYLVSKNKVIAENGYTSSELLKASKDDYIPEEEEKEVNTEEVDISIVDNWNAFNNGDLGNRIVRIKGTVTDISLCYENVYFMRIKNSDDYPLFYQVENAENIKVGDYLDIKGIVLSNSDTAGLYVVTLSN